MTAAMDDLIKRIEAAAAPSFELDAEIAVASGQFVRERRGRDRQDWFYPVGQAWGRRNSSPYCAAHDRLPRYTASIDAALTLVPEGWRFHSADASVVGRCWIMLEGPKTKWAVDSDGYDCAGGDWYTQATAATPALALCAAAIKAHIERTTHD